MKKILIAVLMCGSVFGSGKLSIQVNEYFQYGLAMPQFGVNVREPVLWGWEYDGFVGVGSVPYMEKEMYNWITVRNDAQKWFGDLGVTVGVTLRFAERVIPEQENDAHIRFTYKIW